MSAANKIRGNTAENYVKDKALAKNVNAERAWGSDGRAMGLTAKDDGIIGWLRWQSKRFKHENVPKWFIKNAIEYFNAGIKVVTFYVDRARGHERDVYVIMRLDDWLEIKRLAVLYGREKDERDTD